MKGAQDALGLAGSAYFYFVYDDASSHDTTRLYASLLRQLYDTDEYLRNAINAVFDKLERNGLEASASHLAEVFQDFKFEQGDQASKILIALDGLDELSQAMQTTVCAYFSFSYNASTNINEFQIKSFIEGLNKERFFILASTRDGVVPPEHANKITIRAIPSDLEVYVRRALLHCAAMTSNNYSESERSRIVDDIVHRLIRNASGMLVNAQHPYNRPF